VGIAKIILDFIFNSNLAALMAQRDMGTLPRSAVLHFRFGESLIRISSKLLGSFKPRFSLASSRAFNVHAKETASKKSEGGLKYSTRLEFL
jgi:hypothetical protein